jgi:polyhydroxyalkanoate synthesis regulator phasin
MKPVPIFRRRSFMIEVLQKAIYATVGLAYQTKEKIEEVGKRIAAETKLSEKEGKRLVSELVKRSEDARAAVEKMVNKGIDAALKRANLPSREEYRELEKRVKQLEGKAGK